MTPGLKGDAAGSPVPLVGMHPLEVRQHDLPVQCVAVLDKGVLHHGISDLLLVVTGDVKATPRARLDVGHGPIQPHRSIAQ